MVKVSVSVQELGGVLLPPGMLGIFLSKLLFTKGLTTDTPEISADVKPVPTLVTGLSYTSFISNPFMPEAA